VKVAPFCGVDSTEISPSKWLTIFLQIERPSPTPFGFKFALLARVPKSVNSELYSSLGIPTPVSEIEM
jgi:hypothetical protein